MAELYLAKAMGIAGFEKPCVLKLVLPHLTEDSDFVEMFLTEARLAATLDHPNVAHVVDIGEVDGEYFFVMEYVHGRDVRGLLRACNPGTMPLPAALSIAHGVAEGLHYVHERRDGTGRFLGLVHRDISPSNVMLSHDGSVKIVDFGIAKATEMRHATRTGVLKGKVHYMAPEQCEGHAIDRRTDVFALGILLYEMTTGRPLFTGTNDYYVMSRIVRGVFARPREVDPTYPPELEQIVLRALALDPKDRYVSAQALQVDLEQFARAAGLSVSSRTLAETMHEMFGDATPPNFDEDEEEVAPTRLHQGSFDALAPARGSPTDVLVGPRPTTRVSLPPRRPTVAAVVLGLGLPCLAVGAWAAIELGVGEPAAAAATPAPVDSKVAVDDGTPTPIPLGPPKLVPISPGAAGPASHPRIVALPAVAAVGDGGVLLDDGVDSQGDAQLDEVTVDEVTVDEVAVDEVAVDEVGAEASGGEGGERVGSTELRRRRRPKSVAGGTRPAEQPKHNPSAMYPSGRAR